MRRRAFTLIELTVLITVLAIVAVAVVPSLPNLKVSREERDFRFGVRRLASYAREQAVQRREPVELRIEDGDRNLVVSTVASDLEEGATLQQLTAPPGLQIERMETAAGSASAGDWAIQFEPDGRTSGGGLEFAGTIEPFYLLVRGDGRITLDWGDLPPIQDSEWEAGELEQRL